MCNQIAVLTHCRSGEEVVAHETAHILTSEGGAHAAFTGVLVVLLTLAGASTSVVFPEIAVTSDEAVNPIVRLTAATAIAFSCLTPLLLASAWRGRGRGAGA